MTVEFGVLGSVEADIDGHKLSDDEFEVLTKAV